MKVVYGNLVEGIQEEERVIAPLLNPKKLEQEWPRLHGMISGAYNKFSTEQLCRRILLLHKDILPNTAILASITLCMQLTSVSAASAHRIDLKTNTGLQLEMKNWTSC